MTLREVCGLTTEEIACAFLIPPSTLAQRIVRAKAKIRDAHIPYEIPAAAELPERLDAVLRVVYLVFNEGYAASSGDALARADLSVEAIRLGRLLLELLPEPEAAGLLALMLLQDSRREARTSEAGDIILLDEQDRSLWNREQIDEGLAAIRAVHAAVRDRDARRAGRGTLAHRRDHGTRRTRGLPAGPCRAGGILPPARPDNGGGRVLPPSAQTYQTERSATVP